MHDRIRPLVGATIALLVAAAVLGLLYLARGPVYTIIVVLAFGAGLAVIPAWSYGLLDSVPFLSPLLGKLLLTVGMVSLKTATLTQHDDTSYSIQAADAEAYDPPGYWHRFALGWLGITYERTPAAFGDYLYHSDAKDAVEDANLEEIKKNKYTVDINRGGHGSYISTDVPDDSLLVKTGAKLAELRDSAGSATISRQELESLREYAGDSSQHETTTMAAATFAFAVLGAMLGYVLLFMGGA